jgi:hypothetical protein
MKTKTLIKCITSTAIGLALASASRAQETNKWTFDVTLYGLAASMSGDAMVKGIPVNNVDIGFDKIWENLNFAAMGTVRLGYGRWGFSTDVIYMDLQGNTDSLDLNVQQWMVQPVVEYRVLSQVTVFAGAVYNRINMELSGPAGRNVSDTQPWWDPVVGAQLSLPLGKHFSLNVRGDAGGFGLGSDLTWQAYPYVGWQFAKWGSVQLGYRWIFADYETGTGRNQFKYDMLSQGPQLGVTLIF